MIDKVGMNCVGCGACEAICGADCIKLTPNTEGFFYPVIDETKCIHCDRCERVCPALTSEKANSIFDAVMFGAKPKTNYREDIRNSASGGVFFFLAQYFIEQNGFVFGAVFDNNFCVRHVCAHTMDEVRPMQNSKYVQSDVRGTYKDIKDILSKDSLAYVLFCGTPCQCSGLKSYLKKDYPNLLTADMVCHGVPSPLAFQKYLSNLSKHLQEPVRDYQFRYKLKGWNYRGYMSSYVKYNDHYWPVVKDPYMSAFLKQADYRECCYRCEYNTSVKAADLTLADFAGVKEICPEFFSPDGCSKVYIHNNKGQRFFDNISKYMEIIPLTAAQMKGYGRILTDKRVRKPVRDEIYKDITTLSDVDYVNSRLKKTITVKSIIRFYLPESLRKLVKKI